MKTEVIHHQNQRYQNDGPNCFKSKYLQNYSQFWKNSFSSCISFLLIRKLQLLLFIWQPSKDQTDIYVEEVPFIFTIRRVLLLSRIVLYVIVFYIYTVHLPRRQFECHYKINIKFFCTLLLLLLLQLSSRFLLILL